MSERIIGQELLAHVKRQLEAGYTRDDAARTAGYTKGKLDRTDKVGFEAAFNQALGIEVPGTPGVVRRKRQPTGRLSVHKGGGTAISPAYLKLIGAVAGDEFVVTAEGSTITLVLVDTEIVDELDSEEYEDADAMVEDVELVAA